MDILSLVIFLAIGVSVGWLADNIVATRGFSLIGNILIGIAGAVWGGFVFNLLNIITGTFFGSIIMSTIGAALLLYIINIVRKEE
jgi:uncharacterized membrane protein YeaQ/YmgE (transglycosylase-associated protein family)